MNQAIGINRRGFLEAGAAMSTALGLADSSLAAERVSVRVGVIGCGSVSRAYLPHLSQCPYVELVSACDRRPERAKAQAETFKIPNHYPHIDQMRAGVVYHIVVVGSACSATARVEAMAVANTAKARMPVIGMRGSVDFMVLIGRRRDV